jgi:hypothetical protein
MEGGGCCLSLTYSPNIYLYELRKSTKCLGHDSGLQDNIPNRKVPNAKYARCSVGSLLVTEDCE